MARVWGRALGGTRRPKARKLFCISFVSFAPDFLLPSLGLA